MYVSDLKKGAPQRASEALTLTRMARQSAGSSESVCGVINTALGRPLNVLLNWCPEENVKTLKTD